MQHRVGPLYTLAAGLALALVLLMLNATTGTSGPAAAPGASATPSASASSAEPSEPSGSPPAESSAPAPSPSPESSAPVAPDADYAGHTDGRTASIALALRAGKVQAYLCDGRRTEAWLRGDLQADGSMRLTGKNGSTLEGTLRGKQITGTVTVAGNAQDFSAAQKGKGTSLFRLSTVSGGAQVEGAWIVQGVGSNAEQTGIVTSDGTPAPAPPIDPETGAVTVNGEQETAQPIP